MMPASASEMSISVRDRSRARGRPPRCGRPVLRGRRAVGIAERHLGDAVQPRKRCAWIVRDIVEGLSHASHEGLVALEHFIHEASELDELAMSPTDLHAPREVAGLDDGTSRPCECRYGAQSAARQKDPTSDSEQEKSHEQDDERRPQMGTKMSPRRVVGRELELELSVNGGGDQRVGAVRIPVLEERSPGAIADAYGRAIALEGAGVLDGRAILRRPPRSRTATVSLEPSLRDDQVIARSNPRGRSGTANPTRAEARDEDDHVPGVQPEREGTKPGVDRSLGFLRRT